MSKTFVDEMIRNMKQAGIVTKATPWVFEGIRDAQMSVRYVGINLSDDWLAIFSEKDNVLIKFIIDRNTSYMEIYLANKPPFYRITSLSFQPNDKWETVLGEFRRRLKKDKADYLKHQDAVGNWYANMKSQLK